MLVSCMLLLYTEGLYKKNLPIREVRRLCPSTFWWSLFVLVKKGMSLAIPDGNRRALHLLPFSLHG